MASKAAPQFGSPCYHNVPSLSPVFSPKPTRLANPSPNMKDN